MSRRLSLLVLITTSGCVLDFEQLVLRDGGGSTDAGARDAGAVDGGGGVDGGMDVDAGADAGFDGGTGLDAGADAGFDGGMGLDGGADAGFDGGTSLDAGIDAGFDGGTNVDAGTDAGTRLLDVGAVCSASSDCVTGKCSTVCVPWAAQVQNVVIGSTLVAPDNRPWWLTWLTTPTNFGSSVLQPNPSPGTNPLASRRFGDGTEDATLVLEPAVATLDDMSFTRDGGLVIAGDTYRNFFAGFPIGTLNPNLDSYVARIDPNTMAVSWLTNLGGFRDERHLRIATGTSGDVFVTGWTSSDQLGVSWCVSPSSCDAGSTFVRDGGASNWFTFVARLDGRTAAPHWVKVVRSGNDARSHAIAYSATDDSVVVGGSFIDTLQVEDGGFLGLSGVNDDDGWLLKLSATTGSFSWGRVFGGGSNDSVQSLAIDSTGNIYVGALYANNVSDLTLLPVTPLSPIVVKLSPTNQALWARVLQASAAVTPPRAAQFTPENGYAQIGVLVGPDDNLIVSGWANTALATGTTSLINPVGGDENFIFPLSAMNAAVPPSRVLRFRATNGAVAMPALAPNGNLFVSGTFAGTLTLPLDGGTLTKTSDAGARDFFSANPGRWP